MFYQLFASSVLCCIVACLTELLQNHTGCSVKGKYILILCVITVSCAKIFRIDFNHFAGWHQENAIKWNEEIRMICGRILRYFISNVTLRNQTEIEDIEEHLVHRLRWNSHLEKMNI